MARTRSPEEALYNRAHSLARSKVAASHREEFRALCLEYGGLTVGSSKARTAIVRRYPDEYRATRAEIFDRLKQAAKIAADPEAWAWEWFEQRR